MTEQDRQRFAELCKRAHDLITLSCADLHEALATGDRTAIRLAADNMQMAAVEAQLLSVAMRELARRL